MTANKINLIAMRTYEIPTTYGMREGTFWGYHEDCAECHICGRTTKRFFSFTDCDTECEIVVGPDCLKNVTKKIDSMEKVYFITDNSGETDTDLYYYCHSAAMIDLEYLARNMSDRYSNGSIVIGYKETA